MDLSKTPDAEKVRLSRIYFRGGFAFLPFLWFINTIWFFKVAFFNEQFEGQNEIKKNVIRSGIGALVWIIGIAVWVVIYRTNRASWGATGDAISFLIPLGEP
eukprot:TCONS_00035290-protein